MDAHLEVLTEAECWHLLRMTTIGRLGVVVEEEPHVLPVNFRLIEGASARWIVVRTTPDGTISHANLRAAFEVDGVDPFHRRGWSVLARGRLCGISDEIVAAAGAGIDPHPWPEHDRTRWMGLEIDRLSGRRLGSPENEWAFVVRAYL